jgi:hypothetical protein
MMISRRTTSWGTVTGQVSGGQLTFGGVGSFGPPATADTSAVPPGRSAPAGRAPIVHSATADGLGYAFPYDDVTPNGGVNQAGPVSSGSPAVLTVTVGPVH